LAQQAAGVELDREAVGELRRDARGLGGLALPNLVEEGFEPRAIQHRLIEFLRGADKGTGLVAHRLHHCVERTAGVGHEEHDCLKRTGGHARLDRRFLRLPGARFDQPVARRRVGGAAQEGEHHAVMRALLHRQVRHDPDAIARRQIGDLRQGKRKVAMRYRYAQRWPGEIEGVGFGARRGGR
jgi:hypothetical protein